MWHISLQFNSSEAYVKCHVFNKRIAFQNRSIKLSFKFLVTISILFLEKKERVRVTVLDEEKMSVFST